jgi:hypothetical protein
VSLSHSVWNGLFAPIQAASISAAVAAAAVLARRRLRGAAMAIAAGHMEAHGSSVRATRMRGCAEVAAR